AITVPVYSSTAVPIVGDQLGSNGLPIAEDVNVRAAAATLPPPFNDVTQDVLFQGLIRLPAGFISLNPNASQTSIDLRAVVTNRLQITSAADSRLTVVPDTVPPVVEVVQPPINQEVIEKTPV